MLIEAPAIIHMDGMAINANSSLQELDRMDCEESLYEFLRQSWQWMDPTPFVEGWALEAVADHLQAVCDGSIRRLIINIPPRMGKSTITSAAFPAWVWAQRNSSPTSGPSVQFLHASYAQQLSLRDSVKCRRLIESPWYQSLWGDRFHLLGDQNTKSRFDNDQRGSRLSTSVGSALTGEGGSIIVVDDPNAAQEAFSDATIESTIEWWDSALSTRLNDPKTGAFVVIQQRLGEEDLTGHILSKAVGDWTHLCLPMRFEPERSAVTSIGWQDPRTENGELLWPERFGEEEVAMLERQLGPWAAAGQLQQSPSPRGGGIFKRDWWELWQSPDDSFPPMEYVLVSADTAYTQDQANDPTGCTVWGVYREKGAPRIMLLNAWRKHLELHGVYEPRLADETTAEFNKRTQPKWGLVEWLAHTARKYKADRLIIEGKASGLSVAQEIRRLHGTEGWGVQIVQPTGDKVSRAHAVQPIFSQLLVSAPDKEWAETVISEMESFPKGRYKDLTDSATQAIKFLRETGLIVHRHEADYELTESLRHRGGSSQPLYQV